MVADPVRRSRRMVGCERRADVCGRADWRYGALPHHPSRPPGAGLRARRHRWPLGAPVPAGPSPISARGGSTRDGPGRSGDGRAVEAAAPARHGDGSAGSFAGACLRTQVRSPIAFHPLRSGGRVPHTRGDALAGRLGRALAGEHGAADPGRGGAAGLHRTPSLSMSPEPITRNPPLPRHPERDRDCQRQTPPVQSSVPRALPPVKSSRPGWWPCCRSGWWCSGG